MDSLFEHEKYLNNMCRICGNRAQTRAQIDKRVKPKYCIDYVGEINSCYDVNVKNDSKSVHPTNDICYRTIKNLKYLKNPKNVVLFEYTQHCEKCTVCERYENQKRPQGNPKLMRKPKYIPVMQSSPQPGTSHGHEMISIGTSPIQHFPTPKDRKVEKTPKNALDNSLNQSITSPLDITEEKVYTHLTKRKLKFSEIQKDHNLIVCKTGGQPIVMQKVSCPRSDKPSKSAQNRRI
ncbi:unnamed protein product [Owenia fusiformis]|uniref:Uncharacterized protein n=1 Tax=Owenia fusiformis TaxID=6347 RepID=A0A8S4Q7T6_OWEFU|nr:unnamed protein product [Owenia fusiformis]